MAVQTDGATWLTVAQLSARLGLERTTLRDWRTRRIGPTPTYFSSRSVRYALADVERWEAEQHREAIRRQVAESRARQGLPPTVTDPEVLDRVAGMVAATEVEAADDAP